MISGLKCCGGTGALYEPVQPRADQYFPHTNLILWAAGLKAGSWLWMSFFGRLFVSCCHSLCLSVSLWHRICVSIYIPHLFVSLSAVLSSQHAFHHLSVCVIEPCVLSLSAKLLADRLHFHAEGCEDSMAVVRVIDLDPSKTPPLGSYYCLSSCLVPTLILSGWTKMQHTVQSNTPKFYISFSVYSYVYVNFSPLFFEWLGRPRSLSFNFLLWIYSLLSHIWWINKSLITGW